VILSSGYNKEDTSHHFAAMDLAGFIQKPYSAEHLTEIVQTTIGTRCR